MAQKYVHEVRTIQVTIKRPAGTTYTDQEIANLLKVKSVSPKEVKYVYHDAVQAPE